jgi:hypothetical protein
LFKVDAKNLRKSHESLNNVLEKNEKAVCLRFMKKKIEKNNVFEK